MTTSDAIQIFGDVLILAGYWKMATDIKMASLSLAFGCAVWAYWAQGLNPPAWYLVGLEITLGIMSARTFWINRRK
jgi:hypothetical protein